jgi:hypothetical protein
MLSITHHTRKRPSTDPQTTHAPQYRSLAGEQPDWRLERGNEWEWIKIFSLRELSLYPDCHPKMNLTSNFQDDMSQLMRRLPEEQFNMLKV